MHEGKKSLKDLEKLIEEQKELGDLYEEDSKEKNNIAAKNRCYFSRINQYRLLIEKTQIELDNLISKFDVNSNNSFKYFLAGFGYYKKSISKLNEALQEYSNKLKEYTEKYDDLSKTKERMLTYYPRKL